MISFSARWLRPLLGLVVTGFFLWLLLRQLNFAEVGAALSRISLVSFLLALGFLAAGYTLRIVRWWWMLRVLEPSIPLSACGWPFLVSIAVNNLLPFRAGDALRVVGFRQQLRSPGMRLLGTLVVERLLDLMTLLGIFFIGLLGVASGRIPDTFIGLATGIAMAGIVTILAILLFSPQLERLIHRLADVPLLAQRQWSEPIKQHVSHFFGALGVLRTPTLTLRLMVLSIIIWILEGAVFSVVVQALTIQTATGGPWFALATGTLATLLPSSPGYVGTFDYFTMLGLVAYGAERSTAAAFAVVVHVVLWLPLTLTGMAYFLQPGARRLRRQVGAAVSTPKESM